MKKHRVLIVDDRKINLAILSKMLDSHYDVLLAENGNQALELLHTYGDSIHAVLLDIIMPVMDGYAVLAAMRDDASLPRIPVIVISQPENEHDEEKALSLGANDFVSKPYNPAVILHRLENLIELFEVNASVERLECDSLTGILSKEAFCRRAYERITQDCECKYIILGADIEKFKLINDTYGNDEGDKVLIFVAKKIHRAVCGVNGLCARFAADQFVMLLPCEVESRLANISDFTEKAMSEYPIDIRLTITFGAYPVSDATMPVAAMCDRALLAADSIKGQYGRSIAYYDDTIRQKMLFEQRITSEMTQALEDGQFEIYLQPKYDIMSERIAGAESLVRWNHPEYGLLPPSQFIPIFEKNGFITELDKYVWRKTCELIAGWIAQNGKYVPVSVNVSRKDIYKDNLVSYLAETLEKYGLRSNQLHLEITETAYTENPEQLITVVRKLKELGFIIEMDDFGSGYSSLNMLSELPIDILKLDMRFIQRETAKNSSRNILDFIISLAKWMNLLVVAEGVETQQQIELLRSMDCTYVQGYYYARPMPSAQFTDIVMHSPIADSITLPTKTATTADVIIHNNCGGRVMLIADGVKLNRTILADFFKNAYAIVEADNGLSAFNYIQENFENIAIIMLDLSMPVMDGFELLEKLRENRIYSDIPVILTSQAGESNEVRAFELGASDFISKPYNIDVCIHRVQNVTARNAMQTLEREKHMLAKMRQLALEAKTDSMTGLYNRTELENQVDAFFSYKGNDRRRSVFIMLDIDNFKDINDRLGHAKGDEAIKKAADILRIHFRDDDVVSRMGGDEFGIFMRANLTPQQLSLRLSSLCEKLRFSVDGIKLTCSVGACVSPEFGKTYQQLYQNADIALLTSKRLGKNQYQVYGGTAELPVYAFVRNVDWLLDETSDSMYVCSTEDYSILYINKVACTRAGKTKSECLGKPCYEVLQGRTSPCPFCSSVSKLSKDFRIVNLQSDAYGRAVSVKLKLIDWGGRQARIQYVQDTSELMSAVANIDEQQKKLRIALSHLNAQYWEYDIQHDTYLNIILSNAESTLMRVERSQSFSTESVQIFNDNIKGLTKSNPYAEFDIVDTDYHGSGMRTWHIKSTLLCDKDGKPSSIISTSQQVEQ